MGVNQQNFNFEDTSATRKIFELKKRIRAVAGGTSASKTISIIIWLIDYCQSSKSPQICSVVSESFPHLSGGVIRDFEAIMKDRGYWKDALWNKSSHTYTFETGNILEFLSVDTYGKAHGPRRDILFINEANNISYVIADQLITRTRKIVWMDWNPSEEFWFYTEMLNKRDDIDFITLTYLDNEALDETTVKEIESHRNNKNWWTVYGLGQLGTIETRIYSNWKIIAEIPFEARLERYWIDFGYSNDPASVGEIYYYNGGYIVNELAYGKFMSNRMIADVILNNNKRALTIADCAEPKSIDEIRSYGIQIMPTEKGKDSVNYGIKTVQAQNISILNTSLNTIKEYRNYLWMTDKDGRILTDPEPGDDHSMDGIRYAINSLAPVIRRKEIISHLPIFDTKPKPNPAR